MLGLATPWPCIAQRGDEHCQGESLAGTRHVPTIFDFKPHFFHQFSGTCYWGLEKNGRWSLLMF